MTMILMMMIILLMMIKRLEGRRLKCISSKPSPIVCKCLVLWQSRGLSVVCMGADEVVVRCNDSIYKYIYIYINRT